MYYHSLITDTNIIYFLQLFLIFCLIAPANNFLISILKLQNELILSDNQIDFIISYIYQNIHTI